MQEPSPTRPEETDEDYRTSVHEDTSDNNDQIYEEVLEEHGRYVRNVSEQLNDEWRVLTEQ